MLIIYHAFLNKYILKIYTTLTVLNLIEIQQNKY